jgi:pimeloyl-ACP methyl ester carboxylesterase
VQPTYPSETAFDLPIDGVSMMDLIAVRGYDEYLMDIRGYSASTRPPEMNVPPAENAPIVSTDAAVCDIGSAVEHILQRHGVSKINLMGWSWGTAIAGNYTSEHNDKVNRRAGLDISKGRYHRAGTKSSFSWSGVPWRLRVYPRRLLAGGGGKACLRTEGRSNPARRL